MNQYTTKDGRTFLIRQANEADAPGIIRFAKVLFASTDQVLTTPEEYTITLEEEKAWINNIAAHPGALLLIADMDNRVVGLLDFAAKSKKKAAHTGELGINVHPDYQGMGIGRCLIENLIEWAQDNELIEKLILQVFHTNTVAIGLYKSLGFIEEGRFPKAVKQPDGEYADIIQMYREVESLKK